MSAIHLRDTVFHRAKNPVCNGWPLLDFFVYVPVEGHLCASKHRLQWAIHQMTHVCKQKKKILHSMSMLSKNMLKKLQGLKTALKNMLMGLNFTNISRFLKSLVSTYF